MKPINFMELVRKAERKTRREMIQWRWKHRAADEILFDKVTGLAMRAVYHSPEWLEYEGQKALEFSLRTTTGEECGAP